MRWNVEGADARTGQERIVQITADSRAGAEAKARRQGLLVSAVHESIVHNQAEALDAMVEQATARPSVAPQIPPPQATGALHYRSPGSAGAVPEYFGLRFASVALRVFALIFYIGGILGLLLGLLIMAQGVNTGNAGLGIAMGVVQIIAATLGPLALGAIFHGFSAACNALRDIARNSYRL